MGIEALLGRGKLAVGDILDVIKGFAVHFRAAIVIGVLARAAKAGKLTRLFPSQLRVRVGLVGSKALLGRSELAVGHVLDVVKGSAVHVGAAVLVGELARTAKAGELTWLAPRQGLGLVSFEALLGRSKLAVGDVLDVVEGFTVHVRAAVLVGELA